MRGSSGSRACRRAARSPWPTSTSAISTRSPKTRSGPSTGAQEPSSWLRGSGTWRSRSTPSPTSGLWPWSRQTRRLSSRRRCALPSRRIWRTGPAAAARAEVAWLHGADPAAVRDDSQAALELALQREASWDVGELAVWRRRAGLDEEIDADLPEPYVAELAGEHERAAEAWRAL